ncbi:adenosine deaminase [Mangrovibacterium diazotrophicum]|uniref:Adenine deaminase n=1 Tax=Mangrovibacterium diazotrophicum TaxID=1261403 RepID=A0A419W828_9BACT|nr:adenosine deaminase [Mangrovibacterium diazotrophicum]RKD91512.1 adenosine deaminase [Mangrovibacterium diazotrophicum]
MSKNVPADFINGLPKAELHVHIEGTLEPELLFELAKRNKIDLKYPTVEALKEAYSFSRLQDFLDIYYEGANVLQTEQDFYDLTWAYLQKAKEQGIVHTEIFFDPQTHTSRGIELGVVVTGIHRALDDGREQLGITSKLIMCFLRHMVELSAFKTLEDALPYRHLIYAVGLDSSEKGNPPSKFLDVFLKAKAEGFRLVAHAGEEGPEDYIREAIDLLRVDRIDHGNASIQDDHLVEVLKQRQIPLTLCPLSNKALKVVTNLEEHPLKKMLHKGLLVTVNSDDPAYFGGYINENYEAVSNALLLSKDELAQLAKNSFEGSFLTPDEKQKYLNTIEHYCASFA